MADKNFKLSSFEGALPDVNSSDKTLPQPQAPRSISAAQADADSVIGRQNDPYNPGSTPNGATGHCGSL